MPLKRLHIVFIVIIVLLAVLCAYQVKLLRYFLRRSAMDRITLRQTVTWPKDQPVIGLLGDSRVNQWKPMPNIEGYRIVNLGEGGLTSSQLLFQLLHLEMLKNVKGVVIQVGINDLKAIGLAPRQTDTIIEQCKVNISESVSLLREKGVQVVLLPIIPAGTPGPIRRLAWSEDIDRAVVKVNDYLKTLQQPDVIVPDIEKLYETNGRLKSIYCLDTLHLNTAGYQALNETIKPVLKNTILESQD